MSLVLDPPAEQRVLQKVEKTELDQRLTESAAQFERGKGIPGDQVRERLAQRRNP